MHTNLPNWRKPAAAKPKRDCGTVIFCCAIGLVIGALFGAAF